MADRTPADVLREGHAAFNDRDRDRLLGLVADDVVWHSPGQGPLAGTYRSRDEVWEGFFSLAWDAPLRVEDQQVLATDEFATARADLVVNVGDREERWKLFEVAEVSDGEVKERWAFIDRQDELADLLAQAAA